MSQGAESLTSRSLRRQERGGRSLRGPRYSVGQETGLPLIQCPDCHMARVIELRVKQDTPNKGRSFFKCPRNGNPKYCGFYRFAREYLDVLIEKKVVIVSFDEVDELEVESEAPNSGGNHDDGQTVLEKNIEKLLWKMNCFIVVIAVVVVAIVFRSAVMI